MFPVGLLFGCAAVGAIPVLRNLILEELLPEIQPSEKDETSALSDEKSSEEEMLESSDDTVETGPEIETETEAAVFGNDNRNMKILSFTVPTRSDCQKADGIRYHPDHPLFPCLFML